MTKLALVAPALLALPLALSACATSPQKTAELAEAKSNCTANAKADPDYAGCVNNYLQSHYGWHPAAVRDRSVGEPPAVPQLSVTPTHW